LRHGLCCTSSPLARGAAVRKLTRCPSAEIEALQESSLACAPEELTEASCVPPPAAMSRTKMSWRPFWSEPTRSVAHEPKATNRPSPETTGASLVPLAAEPDMATLTRVVVFACRSRR